MTQVNTQQVVIVGLDIGHGECAATYFRVNEGKSWNPLALTQNKDHVIPSAIYYGADGSITIGKAAAANHDSISYFKRPPSQWDGPVEAHEDLTHRQCMMDFIRTLFADIVTYNRSSVSWFMRVDSMNRVNVNAWAGANELQESFRKIGRQNKYGTVIIDYSSVQAELAAVNQVMQQYGTPINVGLVDDVDAAIAEYRAKLTTAGVEKLVDAIREQTVAYCEQH